MTRDEYNARVQEIMDVVERVAGADNFRVIPVHDKGMNITGARFQVFYDHWRDVGEEVGRIGDPKEYKLWPEADLIIHRYSATHNA